MTIGEVAVVVVVVLGVAVLAYCVLVFGGFLRGRE